MKSTLILASLVIFAAFMGCSDNLNISEPFNNQETASTRNPGEERSIQQICAFEKLSVYASNEFMAENKVVYNNPPFSMPANYWVSFDVHTDANKLTNGYIPIVRIVLDGETVYEGSAFPEGTAATPVKVALENVRFNDLVINAILMQGDTPGVSKDDTQTTLTVCRIKIFREN